MSKLSDKINRSLMTEEEKAIDTAQKMSAVVTSQILSSGVITALRDIGITKAQNALSKDLTELKYNFIAENTKNNQIHEEISRHQDQIDVLTDTIANTPENMDKETVFRLMDMIESSSKTISRMHTQNNGKTAVRQIKRKTVVLGPKDFEEI